MLIKKEQAEKKINWDSCVVWEYPFPSKDLWIAVVKMDGRYPESGKIVNTECDMIYYVISWTWTVHHETGDFDIGKWDSFFFEKNKWYWLDSKNLEILLPTAPTRYFEQYKNI